MSKQREKIYQKLVEMRNEQFYFEHYDDHDDLHFLGNNLSVQLDYIHLVCSYMIDFDDNEESRWVRENSRTRLLDMWHAIDTMYGFPITERVIFDLDTQALWFDSEEYLNSHIFFELFCNTLFQIIEDDNCYKRQFYKDVLPPHGCPSFEEVINHDGKIIELLREQVEKYRGSDWAESDKDIIKWIALKYTFKGDHKSCEKLYSNYKRMGAYKRNESVKQAKSPKKLY